MIPVIVKLCESPQQSWRFTYDLNPAKLKNQAAILAFLCSKLIFSPYRCDCVHMVRTFEPAQAGGLQKIM